jgi:hypothetical protein
MTEAEYLERLQAAGHADETLALIDKLGFARDFILKHVLVTSGAVNVAQIAMLWMGMPNKHDRKRTRQLLDALTASGLLAFDEAAETWTSIT